MPIRFQRQMMESRIGEFYGNMEMEFMRLLNIMKKHLSTEDDFQSIN